MQGAGIIFLNDNNEVLLLLRDDSHDILYPNMWDIPGGNVENDEKPEDTVRREMKEEMGLDDLGDIKLFGIFTSENLTDHVFWKRLDVDPAAVDLQEGQRIEYFSIDRIRNTQLAFNYNDVLEKFFSEIVNNV